MKMIILALLCFALLSGCNSKNYPSDDLPQEQIVFGSGGGFTGEITEYILLKNGQLFQSSSLSGEVKELPHAEKKPTRHCFSMADSLNEIEFKHPGNRYYFITYKTPGGEKKVVWGSTAQKPPLYIKDLYDSLMTIVRNNQKQQ